MVGSRRFAPDTKTFAGIGAKDLIRRVPREFAAYDDRRIVYLATGIRILDDPRA
jgi:hypothetical protein